MLFIRVGIGIVLLLVTGCSGSTGDNAATAGAGKGIEITKAEYGSDWPYTVDSGRLYCDPPGSNVVMASGGRVYALNGRAMGNSAERGYLNARDSITLKDENGYFTIGDTQRIISRGLSMCD